MTSLPFSQWQSAIQYICYWLTIRTGKTIRMIKIQFMLPFKGSFDRSLFLFLLIHHFGSLFTKQCVQRMPIPPVRSGDQVPLESLFWIFVYRFCIYWTQVLTAIAIRIGKVETLAQSTTVYAFRRTVTIKLSKIVYRESRSGSPFWEAFGGAFGAIQWIGSTKARIDDCNQQ